MNCIIIVDGSNLLFQMHYGMPHPIFASDGHPIQGVIGFIGALLKILGMTEASHCAIVFDGEHENPRALIDAAYKANRPALGEDNPFTQLSDIYRALDQLCIPHAETVDCEADDWMASMALLKAPDDQIIISSFDSDLFQLLAPGVSILRYRGKKTAIWTADTLWQKLGIRPCQYAAFKALTGDPSDNIKGIRGVGPKTAARILGSCCFEEALDRLYPLEKDRIMTNLSIIELDSSCKAPFTLDEMRLPSPLPKTREVLASIGLDY